MDLSRPKRILRVLFLYMTVPLLILTAVLAMLELSYQHKRKYSMGTEPAVMKTDQPLPADSVFEKRQPCVAAEAPSPISSTGEAAIITAVMTGITGMLGAIAQSLIAFYKLKEQRSGSDPH